MTFGKELMNESPHHYFYAFLFYAVWAVLFQNGILIVFDRVAILLNNFIALCATGTEDYYFGIEEDSEEEDFEEMH